MTFPAVGPITYKVIKRWTLMFALIFFSCSHFSQNRIPAYEIVASLLLSAGGAHLPHIACIAGNVTPYRGKLK